jgi:hypothetical protein
MAEMGPSEYARKYWDTEVPIINDDNEILRYEKVEFNKYRLYGGEAAKPPVPPPGKVEFREAAYKYFSKFLVKEKFIRLVVKNVWGGRNEFMVSTLKTFNRIMGRAVQAFSGKGSPEDVQLTLQLAARCGVATKGLQQYCDEKVDTYSRLGLDCNGFVGNYLRYRDSSYKWSDASPKGKITSTTMIRDLLQILGTKPITNVDDMMNSRIFVMGLVDNTGTVINQLDSNGRPGHIVITESVSWGKRAVYPPVPKEYLIPNERYLHYSTLEATPGVGLSPGVYAILNMTKSGVATVFRGNVNSTMRVKIYPMI